jgi:hypothetical protein
LGWIPTAAHTSGKVSARRIAASLLVALTPTVRIPARASRLCSLDYFGYILGKRRFIEVRMGIEQRQVGHSASPGSNLLARAIALLQRAKLFQVVSLHLQHLLNQVSGFRIIELGEVFFQFLDQPLLVIHQSGQKMTEGNEMTFCEALVKKQRWPALLYAAR